MKHHYEADSCPADSIVLLLKSLLKVSCLLYRLYFSHICSWNIDVYDDIKTETSVCFSSAVRRVSTNLSDNPVTLPMALSFTQWPIIRLKKYVKGQIIYQRTDNLSKDRLSIKGQIICPLTDVPNCWMTHFWVSEHNFHMDRVKRIWYLSPMRAAKVQASLRIRAVSPEPSLLAHTSSELRGTFRQKARSLAPLNGWACAVKVCHDGMLEDTNSLDGAHILLLIQTKFWPLHNTKIHSKILQKLHHILWYWLC